MAGKKATDFDLRLGERLAEIRRSKRVTQRKLAAHLEMSAAQLQKYEKGTNCMSASALQRTALFLNVSPLDLMDPEVSKLGLSVEDDVAVRALETAEEVVRILRGSPQPAPIASGDGVQA